MILLNRTRYSPSIPARLLREGKLHLLPLYPILRLSDLAREGIDNSGSYRFADHIYAGSPTGRYGIGAILDRLLLSLPSSRSFRNRFFHARNEILSRLLNADVREHRVLSVPCGIPRDLVEAATALRQQRPAVFERTTFYCADIDSAALQEAGALISRHDLPNFRLLQSDAFAEKAYPRDLDLITSTGFGEFLADQQLVHFYNLCLHCLRDGGVFITAATVRHRVSDYLLRNVAELLAHYRDEKALAALFAATRFQDVRFRRDNIGYQVLVTARKVL